MGDRSGGCRIHSLVGLEGQRPSGYEQGVSWGRMGPPLKTYQHLDVYVFLYIIVYGFLDVCGGEETLLDMFGLPGANLLVAFK